MIRKIPDLVWSPLASTLLILIAGGLGMLFHQPWLFPSLGPSAFAHSEFPARASTRFYNSFGGSLISIGAGYLAIFACHAAYAPAAMSAGELAPQRVMAAALAILLTLFLQILTRSIHPPAAATTLLIALGSFKPELRDVAALLAGIFLISAAGEVLRRARLVRAP